MNIFNINHHVKICLTDYGKEILRQRHVELMLQLPKEARRDFKLPVEDEVGWSEWQLWRVMEIFGKYIEMGIPEIPFNPGILLSDEN